MTLAARRTWGWVWSSLTARVESCVSLAAHTFASNNVYFLFCTFWRFQMYWDLRHCQSPDWWQRWKCQPQIWLSRQSLPCSMSALQNLLCCNGRSSRIWASERLFGSTGQFCCFQSNIQMLVLILNAAYIDPAAPSLPDLHSLDRHLRW